MASAQPTDEFTRKRQAQERRLIEEIRYKRSCVRLTPTFPSESEIHKKIRKFVRSVISLVKDNSLSDELAKIRATKSQLFARAEAALYKCRLEKVHMEVSNTMDRIRSAAEGLSMTYEVYGLLVLSEKALATSRDAFYDKEEQGVSLEPSFTAEFVRKELDFLEELNHQIEGEIREAQLQEQNESHESEFEKVKDMISELRKDLSKEWEQIRGEIATQRDTMKSMKESIEAMGESLRKMSEAAARASDIKHDSPQRSNMEEGKEEVENTDDQVEEDLLDFGEEYDCCDSNTEVKEECAPADEVAHEEHSYPEKQKKLELERRKSLIRAFLAAKSDVPERKISYLNSMRPEDTFLVCSFCLAKGQHYSDSCPRYVSVQSRTRRARCTLCLDSRHDTENCWCQEDNVCTVGKETTIKHCALCQSASMTPMWISRESRRNLSPSKTSADQILVQDHPYPRCRGECPNGTIAQRTERSIPEA